jgi:hypothetical protein
MLTSLAACIVIPLLLACWNAGGYLRRSPWPSVAVILWYGVGLARAAVGNIRLPREWDYACFWLYGHIAAAHQNIYDPAVYAGFATPFALDDEFRRAVLDVGFPYPPPTAALFVPLGFIHSVPVGLTIWYAVQFAALAGAAWVLGRALLRDDGPQAALLVLAVVVALPAAIMNVGDAQTNFLVLLLVALALAGRGTAAGAIWEGLALWVKPYAVALLLFDALQLKWRRLIVAAATIAVSLAVSVAVVGPAAFASYLRANPAGREPAFAYVEVINQSLLAIVLRLHGSLPAHVAALHEPLYVAGALVLALFTGVLCARSAAASEVAFAATLLLGLLVYPGALSSYGVVLVIPLLVVWQHRAVFAGGIAGAAGVIATAVLLQSGRFQLGFEANLLMWLACAYLLVAENVRATAASPSRAGTATAGAAR